MGIPTVGESCQKWSCVSGCCKANVIIIKPESNIRPKRTFRQRSYSI